MKVRRKKFMPPSLKSTQGSSTCGGSQYQTAACTNETPLSSQCVGVEDLIHHKIETPELNMMMSGKYPTFVDASAIASTQEDSSTCDSQSQTGLTKNETPLSSQCVRVEDLINDDIDTQQMNEMMSHKPTKEATESTKSPTPVEQQKQKKNTDGQKEQQPRVPVKPVFVKPKKLKARKSKAYQQRKKQENEFLLYLYATLEEIHEIRYRRQQLKSATHFR